MSQKSFILIACALFILSSGYLFWKNQSALDPLADQGWWAVSFLEPHNPASLSFFIDNHSPLALFHYEILEDKVVRERGQISISQGEKKAIPIPLAADPVKQTLVVVESSGKKQEIYR